MRFIFSGPSRKTRKRVKAFFVLLALVAGIMLAAESRFSLFRVKKLDITAQGMVPEYAVWGVIPRGGEDFWPIFYKSKTAYELLLESYYPVKANLTMTGWGKFRLDLKPLKPVIRLFWGGKYWYAAADGHIWLTSLKDNRYVSAEAAMAAPALAWGTDRMTPVELSSMGKGNIFVSSLPMVHVMKWYANIKTLGWNNDVKYVEAIVNEGLPVVRLILNGASGDGGARILFSDDPEQWIEAGLAVKKLYPDVLRLPQNIFIDTTYKGKIIVKNSVK